MRLKAWLRRQRMNLRLNPHYIRLRSWEYWPMHLIYSPIYLYWLYLSLKARGFVFFSAANPGIELGGLFGESKMDILRRVPEEFLPRTLFVPGKQAHDEMLAGMEQAGIGFPLVAKPDVGERGFLVEKIADPEALRQYRAGRNVDILLQEFVDFPEEVSVLYYRFPDQAEGEITSLTLKKYLSVTGDGRSTVRELVCRYPRALLQLSQLEDRYPERLEEVPAAGEEVELVPIGNHCRGATFLNGNAHIDARLRRTFDRLSEQLEGIYFGRFDIKCRSLEDLKEGRHFRILEINGVKAEPTHIYHPGFSIWEAYRVLFRQWDIIYQLSMANKARGITFVSLREALRKSASFYQYKRLAKMQ